MLSKKAVRKIFQFVLVFILITGWMFSGWPQIFNFPPKIQEAHATTIVLTPASANPFVIPSDWNDTNTIHVIGGAGGGGGGGTGGGQDPAAGGGGGAYSVINNLDLNFGDADVDYTVGAGGAGGSGASNGTDGADSIFNGTGSTCVAQSVCAEHGTGGQTTANGGNGGAGGLESNGITEAAGSNGGSGANAGASLGSGGGGAGGDTANGGDAVTTTGGDGGGSGAASGGTVGNAGTNGTEWTTAGSGGGGGGSNKTDGGAGGTDGAGGGGADNGKIGGAGQDGVVVIIYTPVAVTTFTQNDFRWYAASSTVSLDDPWPSGSLDLAENVDLRAIPVQNNPPGVGEEIRLQINLTIGGADLSASAQAFTLEYKAGTDEDCSTGSWTDVGLKASTTVAWRLYDDATLGDSVTEVNQILSSDVAGLYSEVNPNGTNPNGASTTEDVEYDWPIESVSGQVADATTYAFRMVKSGGTVILYTVGDCPTIESEPGTSNLLRHGNFFIDGVEQAFFWAD